MLPNRLHRFVILPYLLLLAACTTGPEVQDREQRVSQAAAATVAAIRAQATPVPRVVEVTRLVEVTRVVSVTFAADATRTMESTRPISAASSATSEPLATDATLQVTSPSSESQTPLAGWKVSEFAEGNAEFPYPAGIAGEISIVHQSICSGEKQTVCLVVRNNLSEPVAHIYASGVARTPDGSLFAVGEGQLSFEPKYVMPGELTFGHVWFGVDLLPNTEYEMELDVDYV